MENDPSGSVEPLPCRPSRGIWPTCYGYIRGRNPSDEEILRMRATMTWFCIRNQLHLSRIYHDWQVEPDRLKYPALLHALDSADQPGTHGLLLGDLDFLRDPSPVLSTLAEVILKTMPTLKVLLRG